MIEIRNLNKKFKSITLFENINYVFEKGKKYAITGVNGSGKSVLLKVLCGYSLPDKGSIVVNKVTLGKATDFIQNAGVTINAAEFVNEYTGFENLKILADIQKKIGTAEILAWCDKFALTADINKKYKTYSLGMKQKMRLVQALMEDPDILILDEPFNALDANSTKLARNILNEFMNENRILIFTSHHSDDVVEIADKILKLEEYKLVDAN